MNSVYSCEIIVSDRERALGFYRDTLGWKVRDTEDIGDGVRFVTVVIPGDSVGIQLGLPTDADTQEAVARRQPGGHTGISIMTDDIQGDYDRLTAKGVTFTTPPADMPWGMTATWFHDPDGNVFFLGG